MTRFAGIWIESVRIASEHKNPDFPHTAQRAPRVAIGLDCALAQQMIATSGRSRHSPD